MNQMNAGGMNPGVGGPQLRWESQQLEYIYLRLLLKRGYHDCARALLREESMKINTDPGTKTSPGNRQNDMNGVDGDMMTDGKDGEKIKIPDDLPRASLPNDSTQTAFLLDWWSLFWEFWQAQRKRGNNHDIRQYLSHNQALMRVREQQQNQLMRQQPMMPGQMPLNMRRNGMHPVPPNLQKTVLQNTTGLYVQDIMMLFPIPFFTGSQQQLAQQFQKNQQMQIMQQMQRDQPDMDMNGNRPQSPASADNAPSPSKRPRLEGGPVNGQQLAPNGRGQGQGMQGQPNPQAQAIMMQNGMNRGMNPAQFQQFQQGQAAQQKSMQVYAQNLALHHTRSALSPQGLPNGGMMNPGVMPNQTDLVAMQDANGGMFPGAEYYQNAQMPPGRNGMQQPNGQQGGGNHALQDYQMQLMLLEQQNKRRLMMARQEQDSMARDGQPMPGQGQLPPGTSPQGSRTGASPNPSEQMKRGTPKMPQSGLPGSPSAGDMGQNRGSPGSMNLNGGPMPPEMAAQFFQGNPNMRPPSSNPQFTGPQMGQPIPAGAGGRMPSGQWQQPGQPMPPQHSPASQPQAGTPQERNAMPPPQAPPTGPAGRTHPQSPQTGANAPPTPQQGNKAAPGKGKKEGAKENTRKRPKKGAAAAANAANAQAPEAGETAQTPTPSTPVTPQHPNSFNKAGANGGANAQIQPTSAPAPPTMVQPTMDPNPQSYNDLSIPDNAFNLDFGALDNPDILESFDFDTFLNTDGDGTGFGFDPNMPLSIDGVEAGPDMG
ncbi:Transcriptional activator somA [Penicillium cosmopolitanum]|uniref:Transcriptional activator somA n=1 Tax=Penicillium cosmopolitanum TaxID=1131564 RepID=A0A9W9SCY0_9EURO|nr:Transcriptional activator somA [Penicillium cosmopolitanum]KAJ5376323.1 Transcriptional activator somA [Penicillium cosmopolitanum]